jgi:tRNA pseudouridine55 synthase
MLLLIDKPSWITSHDAISAVKKHIRDPMRDALTPEQRAQGIKPPKIKIWHAGTLDPMASWLLIAATDRDTRQLHTLTWQDKSYRAVIDFSQSSDTRDMDYRKDHSSVDLAVYGWEIPLADIEQRLQSIIGTTDLPLTPFSARKVHGKKLYEYARDWKAIFLTVPMTVHGYEIIEYSFPLLTVQLHVWSGTYIRSIAHRLGIQCWWDALLMGLCRTQIGRYQRDQITQEDMKIATRDDKQIYYKEVFLER